MPTRSAPVLPVRYGWEELLDRRIDLLKEASRRGNGHLFAALQVQDRLSDVDHVATFYEEAKALGLASCDIADKIIKELENRLLEVNDKDKADADMTGQALQDEADKNDPNEDDWQELLVNQFENIEGNSGERFESLRAFAKEKIQQLPRTIRPSAAWAFTSSSDAITQFVHHETRFLEGALETVGRWYKNPDQLTERWATQTSEWHDNTKGTIKRRFGDRIAFDPFDYRIDLDAFDSFSSSFSAFPTPRSTASSSTTAGVFPVRKGATKAGAAAAFASATAKLEKAGLDRFVLVKKGNDWVIQLEL